MSVPKKFKFTKFFDAWSLSRLKDYEQCPFKAAMVHLEKRKGPGNEAMDRGSQIHTMAATYIKGQLKKLPQELSKFKKEMLEFRNDKTTLVEDDCKWGFDKEWRSVGFFGRGVWLRSVIDALRKPKPRVLLVVDHKTGKYKPDRVVEYKDQLKLYAPVSFVQYPEVEQVDTKIFFLDHKKTEKDTYHRKQLPELMTYWNRRVSPMMADRQFTPKPGYYCTYCHLSKKKGGPCIY